jgi:hypothetical protein
MSGAVSVWGVAERRAAEDMVMSEIPFGAQRIYFAGKIGTACDWRSEIFPKHLFDGGGIKSDNDADHIFDIGRVVHVGGDILYGGPFFINYEHGGRAYHHGAAGTYIETSERYGSRRVARKDIFRINNARILRANYMFAFIDSHDAYGTFFEIGFAIANGVPVYLSFSKDLNKYDNIDQFWYLREGAMDSICGLDPKEAFGLFCKKAQLDWPGYAWVGVAPGIMQGRSGPN